LGVSLLASGTVAQAASIKIGQLPDYSDISVDSITYQINAPLGRARVDVVFLSEGFASFCGDDCSSPYDEEQLLVPGLSYSSTSSQVLYTDVNGAITVCAELATKNGIFGKKTYYKPTGLCSISMSKETQTTDDGFNQTNETDTAVIFNTK